MAFQSEYEAPESDPWFGRPPSPPSPGDKSVAFRTMLKRVGDQLSSQDIRAVAYMYSLPNWEQNSTALGVLSRLHKERKFSRQYRPAGGASLQHQPPRRYASVLEYGRMSGGVAQELRTSFNKLVATQVWPRLSKMECERLRYFYKDLPAVSATVSESDGSTLSLFHTLEKARVFSYDHPEHLAEVMEELGREDIRKEVQTFIERHKTTITQLQEGGDLLSRDGPYRATQVRQPDTDEDPYCRFFSPSQLGLLPESTTDPRDILRSPTSSSDSSGSPPSSLSIASGDVEEPPYENPALLMMPGRSGSLKESGKPTASPVTATDLATSRQTYRPSRSSDSEPEKDTLTWRLSRADLCKPVFKHSSKTFKKELRVRSSGCRSKPVLLKFRLHANGIGHDKDNSVTLEVLVDVTNNSFRQQIANTQLNLTVTILISPADPSRRSSSTSGFASSPGSITPTPDTSDPRLLSSLQQLSASLVM